MLFKSFLNIKSNARTETNEITNNLIIKLTTPIILKNSTPKYVNNEANKTIRVNDRFFLFNKKLNKILKLIPLLLDARIQTYKVNNILKISTEESP